ncbi:MAG: sigma 54-interacting transcriptional regulator [Desulfamplus sp.]|nr:sigma 54-interacting transcriptional regulator [Desulfamplus sp.]
MAGIVNPEDMDRRQQYRSRLRDVDFLSVFDEFSDGVIVTDKDGLIVYYNKAISRIDELKPADALYKKITEVYHLTEEKSIIMRCLKKGSPIIDEPIYYRTRMGKFANTIHSTFPLIKDHKIIGVICFVRDYNVLAESIENMPVPKNMFSDDIFFDSIVGEDPELVRAVNSARMAANTPSPIMLYGETGTGKELFARAIHHHSTRGANKYTPINCAAIPENLLEGILFGTSKGAFTGALNKAGLFERTNGGTIFLDEINSMPVGLQSKILRVLQERKVRRVGALKEIEIDVKIISSVNIDPYVAIRQGTLRSDLFYRLGVVFISIVPLARRIGDIELLISHFIKKHNKILNKNVICISKEVMELFKIYHWPGNVRELEHVIEGAMNIVGYEDVIRMHHLQSHFSNWSLKNAALKSIRPHLPDMQSGPVIHEKSSKTRQIESIGEKIEHPAINNTIEIPAVNNTIKHAAANNTKDEGKFIHNILLKYKGNIARSANALGISRQLLYYKIRKYKLVRTDYLPEQV